MHNVSLHILNDLSLYFTVLRPTFQIDQQQDVHEFLLLLLSDIMDVLHTHEYARTPFVNDSFDNCIPREL